MSHFIIYCSQPNTLIADVAKMLVRITSLDWLALSTSYFPHFMLMPCVVIATNYCPEAVVLANNWTTLFLGMISEITFKQTMLTLIACMMLFLQVDNNYYTERQTFFLVAYHLLLFTVVPLLCVFNLEQLQYVSEFLVTCEKHASDVLEFITLNYIWPVFIWVLTLHSCILAFSIYVFYAGVTSDRLTLYRKVLVVIRCLLIVRLAIALSLVFMTLCPEQFMEHYSSMTCDMGITSTQGLLGFSFIDLMMKCVEPFLKVAYCEQEYIPFVPTYLLKSGTDSLVRMYDYYPEGSQVKQFLANNCSHLLRPLEGPTTIPVEMTSASHLLSNGAISLPQDYDVSVIKHMQRKAGVYVFIDNDNVNVSQCGACIDFRDRLYSHYRHVYSVKIPFYEVVNKYGGFHHFSFAPVTVTPNYFYEYVALHQQTVSPEDSYVLKSFTQQETRGLEQAYSSFAKPKCYKGIPISIGHGKWVPGTFTEHSGKSVEWTTLKGEVHKAMSIAEAADYLEVDPSTVRKKANCYTDTYVDSAVYGKVKVHIKGMPYVNKSSDRLPQFVDINMDTSTLPVNKVFLYDQYLNKMEQGPFDKVRDAVNALGVKWQKKFFTMINKEALIYSHVLGASYYLVSNQESKLKASIVRNLTDGTSTSYNSMTSAVNSLKPTIKVPTFVRKYVLKKEPYEFEGKQYLVEFANKADYDNTVQRVKSERHTVYKNSVGKA